MAALLIATDAPHAPVLGTPLIEIQLRRARSAGAGHAVVFVERVTAALLTSIDRLRAEGMSVDVARTVADAAEFVHPDEAVLMIAGDLLVAPERLSALAASVVPMLLCVRDEPANARFELIDATARWTGFARLDGGLIRRTAALVGDWDLASTLLRRAVQEGAERLTLAPDEAGRDLMILGGATEARSVARRLIASASVEPAGWATHWLLGPVARRLAGTVGEAGVAARWVTLSGLFALVAATACALGGWIVASLVLLLGGLIFDLAGALGDRASAGPDSFGRWRFAVRATVGMIVAIAMGITMTLRMAQWGCAVLAVSMIGAAWLSAPLARDDVRFARWRADPAGLAVIGLIGFAAGLPVVALAIAAIHAALSLSAAIRRTMGGLARS